MIQELLRKYRSITNIPEGELKAGGFELVSENGNVRLRRIGAQPDKSKKTRVCEIYGLQEPTLPATATPNTIARLARIAKHYYMVDEANPAAGKSYHCHDWFDYVRAWSKGKENADAFLSSYEPYRTLTQGFVRLGLNLNLWRRGIAPYQMEVATGKVISRAEHLESLFGELRQAFTDLIGHELAHPQSCLKELKVKVQAKTATIEDVLAAVQSDEDKIRTLVTVSLQRSKRKGEYVGQGASLFHLNNVRTKLVRHAESGIGTFTVKLSQKNPFTDLDLGNNAGCCIGIYLDSEGEFGEGFGAANIPLYFLNTAIQFVELWRGRERCGLAMLFAGVDADGQPILAVNSIELNAKLQDVAGQVTDAMVCWIMEFAAAVGFKQAGMGVHDYNTACNHGLNARFVESQKITGVHVIYSGEGGDYMFFSLAHSDILHDDGEIKTLAVLRNPRHCEALEKDLERSEAVEPRAISFEAAYNDLLRHLHQTFAFFAGPEEYEREGIAAKPRNFLLTRNAKIAQQCLTNHREYVALAASHLQCRSDGKLLAIACLIPGIFNEKIETLRFD